MHRRTGGFTNSLRVCVAHSSIFQTHSTPHPTQPSLNAVALHVAVAKISACPYRSASRAPVRVSFCRAASLSASSTPKTFHYYLLRLSFRPSTNNFMYVGRSDGWLVAGCSRCVHQRAAEKRVTDWEAPRVCGMCKSECANARVLAPTRRSNISHLPLPLRFLVVQAASDTPMNRLEHTSKHTRRWKKKKKEKILNSQDSRKWKRVLVQILRSFCNCVSAS